MARWMAHARFPALSASGWLRLRTERFERVS
jgi:hypothetical protein